MSAALELFTYGSHEVRVVTANGEPWFVAADVAKVLGYRMASDMTRRLESDEKGYAELRTPGGDQEMTIISESGLYAAVFGSQLPEAKDFRQWVTRDVLPAIRRTGTYSAPVAQPVDVAALDRRALALMVIEAEDARQLAEARVAELEPQAAFTQALLTTSGDYSVREAAQILTRDHGLATGQRRLFGYLREIGWIDRRGTPYQRHIEAGRLTVRVRTYDHPHTGEPTLADPQVRITPKGLVELHKRLAPSTAVVPAGGVQADGARAAS